MNSYLLRTWATTLLAFAALIGHAQKLSPASGLAPSEPTTIKEAAKPIGTLGTLVTATLSNLPQLLVCSSKRQTGKRCYELTDHLSNVRAVVSDRRLAQTIGTSIFDFLTDVKSWDDYYAFGQPLNGRHVNSPDYRYGFNGFEEDDEWKGDAQHHTTQYRQYDPRIGRWMSIDPVLHIELSPFNAFDNNPIAFADPNGADALPHNGRDNHAKGGNGGGGKPPKSHAAEKTKTVRNKQLAQVQWKNTTANKSKPGSDGSLGRPATYDWQTGKVGYQKQSRTTTPGLTAGTLHTGKGGGGGSMGQIKGLAPQFKYQSPIANLGKIGKGLGLAGALAIAGGSYFEGADLAEQQWGNYFRGVRASDKLNHQYAFYLAASAAVNIRVNDTRLIEVVNHPLFIPALADYIYDGREPFWIYSEGGVGPGNFKNWVHWTADAIKFKKLYPEAPSSFIDNSGSHISYPEGGQLKTFEEWGGRALYLGMGIEDPNKKTYAGENNFLTGTRYHQK